MQENNPEEFVMLLKWGEFIEDSSLHAEGKIKRAGVYGVAVWPDGSARAMISGSAVPENWATGGDRMYKMLETFGIVTDEKSAEMACERHLRKTLKGCNSSFLRDQLELARKQYDLDFENYVMSGSPTTAGKSDALRDALRKIMRMIEIQCSDEFGDESKASGYACYQVAKKALESNP